MLLLVHHATDLVAAESFSVSRCVSLAVLLYPFFFQQWQPRLENIHFS